MSYIINGGYDKMYARRKVLLLAIGLCVIIGCGEKKETFVRKANLDFKGNVARFEYHGFSMKLYPEYKIITSGENAFCFVSDTNVNKNISKNLAILFWNRDAGLYKQYSDAVSKPQNFQDVDMLIKLEELGVTDKLIKAYKMNKPDFDLDCVLWTKDNKPFRKKANRVRLELFPKDKKYQITVVMSGDEKDLNQMFDMAESIKTFPRKNKLINPKHVGEKLLDPKTLEPLNPFSKQF